MKINSFNNLSFQKRIVGKGCVLDSQNRKVPCNISKLENVVDNDYFEGVLKTPEWQYPTYLNQLQSSIDMYLPNPRYRIYTLEKEDTGECLAYNCVADEGTRFYGKYFEVAPPYRRDSLNYSVEPPKYSHIGQLFMGFLSKLANYELKNTMEFDISSPDAKKFYDKIGCKRIGSTYYVLDEASRNKIIDKAENETGFISLANKLR